MAGYSGTPLERKLGIREGSALAVVGGDAHFVAGLQLPPGAHIASADEPLDVALLFATTVAEIEDAFGLLAARLQTAGSLWVTWPKKASGVATELTFEPVQAYGLAAGMVDNKVCAIDATWSALRFVFRRSDRPNRRS